MITTVTVPPALAGFRLDEAVARLAGISKGESRRIVDRGGCAVNRTMVRVASRCVAAGDMLTVGIMQPGEYQELVLGSDAVVYQDGDLLAINKPSGIASQRTPYQLKGTLEYWVAEEFVRQGVREPVRVVHRLDRGTSGLMLFPKHRQSAAWLSELFRCGTIRKRYLALVAGVPPASEWRSDGAIGKIGSSRWGIVAGGRPALTEFRIVGTVGRWSLVEAVPRTGRTHQIRVHLSAAGLPIVGDQAYGGESAQRLMLHCMQLVFRSRTGQELDLTALPDDSFPRPG